MDGPSTPATCSSKPSTEVSRRRGGEAVDSWTGEVADAADERDSWMARGDRRSGDARCPGTGWRRCSASALLLAHRKRQARRARRTWTTGATSATERSRAVRSDWPVGVGRHRGLAVAHGHTAEGRLRERPAQSRRPQGRRRLGSGKRQGRRRPVQGVRRARV